MFPMSQDMQRPLYMRPMDALEYGLIDEIIAPNEDKERKAISYWARSGRAESDGRLEQWQEYLALQEEYALKDAFKKTQGQVGRMTVCCVLWGEPGVKVLCWSADRNGSGLRGTSRQGHNFMEEQQLCLLSLLVSL